VRTVLGDVGLLGGNIGPVNTRVRRRIPTQVPTQITYPTRARTLSLVSKAVRGQSPTQALTGYIRRLASRWKEMEGTGSIGLPGHYSTTEEPC
jgi:hypothetical protein